MKQLPRENCDYDSCCNLTPGRETHARGHTNVRARALHRIRFPTHLTKERDSVDFWNLGTIVETAPRALEWPAVAWVIEQLFLRNVPFDRLWHSNARLTRVR